MSAFETAKKIVAGDVAHDAADAGGPVKIGGKAASALPAAVSNGDRVDAYFDQYGRMVVSADVPVFPTTLSPLRRWLSVAGSVFTGNKIWEKPSSAGVRVLDVAFSTDAALNLTLHQSTITEYVAKATTDGALALWPLNDASGVAVDAVGSNDLTALGTPTYAQGSLICANGRSVLLDGVSGAFRSTTKLASATSGAMEAWIYLTATPGAVQVYFSAADEASTNYQLHCSIDTDAKPNLTVKSAGTTFDTVVADIVLAPKAWYHVVWSHDGTGYECYVNGQNIAVSYLVGGTSSTVFYDEIYSFVDNVCIGVLYRTSAQYFFSGKVALVAWYGTTVAGSIWLDHYRQGAPILGPHYFGDNAGLAAPNRTPLSLLDNCSIYVSTSGNANATIELLGYEE